MIIADIARTSEVITIGAGIVVAVIFLLVRV